MIKKLTTLLLLVLVAMPALASDGEWVLVTDRDGIQVFRQDCLLYTSPSPRD